jgi:sugar phosphate isomerase/epimerase
LCSPGYREFASLADGKQTKKIIEDHGLTCVSSHFTSTSSATPAEGDSVGARRRPDADRHREPPANMGTQAQPIITMVNDVTTEDSIKRAADAYHKIAAVAKKGGLAAVLHNETFENSRTIDGR